MTDNEKHDRDRNLLFGVLAVQLKHIAPADLSRAAAVWAAEDDKDLGSVLVELGSMDENSRALIENLLGERVKAHGGDASKTLGSLGGAAAVDASFAGTITFDEQNPECTLMCEGPPDEGTLMSFGGQEATPGIAPSMGPTAEGLLHGERLDGGDKITIEQSGRYTVKGEHGRGGIGRVLIAFDEHVGREVALKELLPQCAAGQGSGPTPGGVTRAALSRFLREARITAQLEHPGVVPVYEIGKRADQSTYYTMKLVRGMTLDDKIKQAPGLAERLRLLPHFLDLCQAMAYAHDKDVFHRDLKPANVMVGEFGETVVLDWGLAKVKGLEDIRADEIEKHLQLIKETGASQTIAGQPLGTPSYMSPEQAEGRVADVGQRSDVWSLGAILYEILTGRPPFTGNTAWEVMGRVLASEPDPVAEIEQKAPPELVAIAMKCLAKDPRERYADASEIARDIVTFQSGGLVSSYEYSLSALAWRQARKHWRALVLAAAIVAGVALAAINYTQARAVENLSAAIIDRTADRAETELMRFFMPVKKNILVAKAWGQAGSLGTSDEEAPDLNHRFMPMLVQYPQVSSMMIGNTEGLEYLLLRIDDYWLNRITRADEWGKKTFWMKWSDADNKIMEEWRDLDYDPRVRPWFKGAIENDDPLEPHWTDPYIFFTTKDPGITASIKWKPAPNAPAHVTAFDVLLIDISLFTNKLAPSDNGSAFVLTQDLEVIGLPRGDRFAGADNIKASVLKPYDELAVPELAAAVESWQRTGAKKPLRFEAGGGEWWAGFRAFHLGPERNFWIGVVVPEDDILGDIEQRQGAVILALGIALLAVILFFAIYGLVMRTLAKKMEALDMRGQAANGVDQRS